MKKTHSAGGVVMNQMGQILIVSQPRKTWSLPKGHIEPDETVMAAARREIYEESGISELVYVKDLGSYERFKLGKFGDDDIKELKTLTFFQFTTPQMILNPIDKKHAEARWVGPDEVADFLSHEKDKLFFLSIKDSL